MKTVLSQPVKLDGRSKEAVYRQITNHLRELIVSKRLPPGSQLPSTRQLCESFGGRNHLTIRQAVRALAEEGLVEAVQGRGTFVVDRSKQTRRIGLVLPNLEDALTVRIAAGVQEVLDGKRGRAVIMDSRRSASIEAENIRQLGELPLDGAIIYPVHADVVTDALFQFKATGLPFVLVDSGVIGFEARCVTVDHHEASYQVTTHLARRGCRRIGWVGESGTSAMEARYQGFRDGLNDNGMLLDRDYEGRVDVQPPMGPYETFVRDVVKRMMQLPHPPDGLVFGNDLFAFAGLRALRALGVSVPGEVAVVGIDDYPEASTCEPALTTARRPMERQGELAAEMLLESVEKSGQAVRQETLPVELVVRDSA